MAKPYKRKSKEEKEKEVNELIEKANVGIENCFTTPEQLKELASYMSRFYNYSLRNTFLIQEQFKGALAVGSYAFWREKGFTVNKGEKGIKILVPNKLSDYFINEKGEEVKLKDANPEERKLIEQGEIEVRQGKLIFNQGHVFEVSQTNAKAEDLPKIFPNRWLDGEIKNYDLMYKAMENIAKKIGVKIIEPKDELGAVKGVSYPATKEVALNHRNTQLQNVKTLIHELTHAKLHTMETRDNYTTNAKEFQAEMAAYVVCSYFGLDTSEYSFRYISSWTKDVELKNKEKLINEVRETVKEYIYVIEKTLINDKELSLSLEKKNSLEKKENIEDDKNLYEIKEQEVMRDDKELQQAYNKWRELVGRENWCKLQLAGEDVTLKPIESDNIQARKDFSKFAKLESEITLDEMLKLENIYEENLFQNLSNIDKLEEENYKIDKSKEYQTLFDLELKDGSFIKEGTSFIVEGFKDGKYEIHFSEQEGNIYIPDNRTGDMYYFDEAEIEKFTDLSKGKVIFEEKEVVKEIEQTRENDNWKLTEKEIAEAERLVELDEVKEKIEKLMKENYGDFIRAIISIEIGIEDIELLDNIYEEYMDSDFKFINDKFEDLKNELGKEKLDMRDEKKEKEIWRKIREHEEWVKSNGLRGQKLNLENENLKGMRLINLDLREANLKGADMTQCIVYADLRGANLTGAKIENSEWIGSNINNVTIEANKLNLIEYQMEQEKELHLSSMNKLKTKEKEKEMNM